MTFNHQQIAGGAILQIIGIEIAIIIAGAIAGAIGAAGAALIGGGKIGAIAMAGAGAGVLGLIAMAAIGAGVQLRERENPVYHHERRDSDTSFKRVLSILNVIHENLREVVIADEKLIVIDGQNALSFEWEGHGLKMEIPARAAGSARAAPLEIGVVALVAGRFEFPPGTQLVSGVYAISSSRRLHQPVELQMQHCVDLHSAQQAMSLYFVRARCSQSNLPYRFYYMEQGTFPIVDNNYGSIVLEQFSILAMVRRWRSPSQMSVEDPIRKGDAIQTQSASQTEISTTSSLLYSAHAYRQSERTRVWLTLFSVTKKLELLEQYMKKKYKTATFIMNFKFKFKKDKIELLLNKIQRKDKWIICTLTHPCILSQEAVDMMGDSDSEPPTCFITLQAEADANEDLYYEVPIIGTEEENRCFIIKCHITDTISNVFYKLISAPPTTHATTSSTSSGHGAVTTDSTTSSDMPTFSDMPTSTVLKIGDLSDVMKAVLSVTTKWYNLGLFLGLHPDTLDRIKGDNKGDVEDSKREMLSAWLRCDHNAEKDPRHLPSWKNLVAALRDTRSHNDLAMEIEKLHIS